MREKISGGGSRFSPVEIRVTFSGQRQGTGTSFNPSLHRLCCSGINWGKQCTAQLVQLFSTLDRNHLFPGLIHSLPLAA